MWRFSWRSLVALSAVNRFFLRRFTPAGRVVLVAAGAAAVFGIDTERSMTYQAFTLLVAVVVAGGVGALGFRPAVRVARELPRTATAGEPFVYRIALDNLARRPLAGVVLTDQLVDPRPGYETFRDAGPPPGARSWLARMSGYRRWRWLIALRSLASPQPLAVDLIAPGGRCELAARLVPSRRGVLRFAAITLARPDPLGVVQSARDLACPGTVLVLPRRYRLPAFTLPGARRFQQGGVALAGSVGDSEEFLALRAYRPGDPLQRVHWRSFARLGEPVVREMQDEFFERHALVLDTSGDRSCAERFEEAVSVAASFASTLDTRECLLDLVFIGERPHRLTAGRGLASAVRLLEALAAAQPSPPAAFDRLARSVLAQAHEHAGAILVLLDWDEARAALVRGLRSQGVAVLAFVLVERGAQPPVRSPWLRVLEVGRVGEDLVRAVARP